jgi:Mg2+ and Co2+ transporter CorA
MLRTNEKQAFNLVTQRDSIIIKNDSHSMKTIAVMTLVFLPLTAVAVR